MSLESTSITIAKSSCMAQLSVYEAIPTQSHPSVLSGIPDPVLPHEGSQHRSVVTFKASTANIVRPRNPQN